MKNAFTFAVIGEALTGLLLLVLPTLVGRLLLGAELTGAGIPVARVAGIALIGLSIACLPGLALAGMLTYSALVTLYLAYVGPRRRVDRHSVVAGRDVACDPNVPSRPAVVQTTRGKTNLTTRAMVCR